MKSNKEKSWGSWGAYECIPCFVVFEVQFKKELADVVAKCPVCGELCTLDAQWEATEGGYGSTSEKDALIEQLKLAVHDAGPVKFQSVNLSDFMKQRRGGGEL